MKTNNETVLRPAFTGVLAVVALAVAAVPALAYTGQQFERQARISMRQAEAVVARTVPGGRITDRELEKERGGSGLRYSFDVKPPHGKTLEIGVDAMTGKLLEDSVEGPNAD